MDNFGMCSDWYSLRKDPGNYRKFCTILRRGDIIQIALQDSLYRWAICMEAGVNPKVAHRFDGTFKDKLGQLMSPVRGSVHQLALDDLAQGGRVRNNNYRDRVTEPKPVRDVVNGVLQAMEDGVDQHFGNYCPLTNSDAQFVEVARYGRDAMDSRLGGDGRSAWYVMEDVEAFFWLLKKGDMVEFNMSGPSTWAVCISEPHVQESNRELILRHSLGCVHNLWSTPEVGDIYYSNFRALAKLCRFRIDNSADAKLTPDSPESICETANKQTWIPDICPHDVVNNNSWHFAMRLRYGIGLDSMVEWKSILRSPSEVHFKDGDIIQFKKSNREDWAIFISNDQEGKQVPKVAYRQQSSSGPALVCTATLEYFFSGVVDDREFSHHYVWDNYWMPRKCEDIIASVLQADGQEDPCQCDLFWGICPHFVVGLRYGTEARDVMLTAFSGWCSHQYLDVFQLQMLQTGDIIEVRKGFHPHFAVYVGDGQVVHCCDSDIKDRSGCHDVVEVRTSLLEDVVEEGEVRINNFLDFSHRPRKIKHIVRLALQETKDCDKFSKYDKNSNNCRHFVIQIRYCLESGVEDLADMPQQIENSEYQENDVDLWEEETSDFNDFHEIRFEEDSEYLESYVYDSPTYNQIEVLQNSEEAGKVHKCLANLQLTKPNSRK